MLIPKICIFLDICKVGWAPVCSINLFFFPLSFSKLLTATYRICVTSSHLLHDLQQSGSPTTTALKFAFLNNLLFFCLTSLLCQILFWVLGPYSALVSLLLF